MKKIEAKQIFAMAKILSLCVSSIALYLLCDKGFFNEVSALEKEHSKDCLETLIEQMLLREKSVKNITEQIKTKQRLIDTPWISGVKEKKIINTIYFPKGAYGWGYSTEFNQYDFKTLDKFIAQDIKSLDKHKTDGEYYTTSYKKMGVQYGVNAQTAYRSTIKLRESHIIRIVKEATRGDIVWEFLLDDCPHETNSIFIHETIALINNINIMDKLFLSVVAIHNKGMFKNCQIERTGFLKDNLYFDYWTSYLSGILGIKNSQRVNIEAKMRDMGYVSVNSKSRRRRQMAFSRNNILKMEENEIKNVIRNYKDLKDYVSNN